MAGIATVVLITTINLRMAGIGIRGRGFGISFCHCRIIASLAPLPVRFRNENVAERLLDLAFPHPPAFYDIIKNWERGGGIDRNLDSSSFPPFRFHSSSPPPPFLSQTNHSIRSFILSLLFPHSSLSLSLSRITTDR